MAGGTKSFDAASPGVTPAGSEKPATPLSACAISPRLFFRPGTPRTRTSPSTSSRSSAATSSIADATALALSATMLRRDVQRAAGGDRLAAGIGAVAERGGGGVAGDHLHALGRDAEGLGGELRQHGVGALALVGGAGRDHDRAGRPDAHADALERPAAGAFDIVGEPEPDVAALLARRLLPRREIAPAGGRERAALRFRIVAAVVGHRQAVARHHLA